MLTKLTVVITSHYTQHKIIMLYTLKYIYYMSITSQWKMFSFVELQFIFSFVACTQGHEHLPPHDFFFRSFIVLTSYLDLFFQFELTFVYAVREWSNFILACRRPVVPASFAEEIVLSSLNGLSNLVENQLKMYIFISGLSIQFHLSKCR